MKKLTPKIVLTGFIVIIITSFIPNIILFVIGEGQRPVEFASPSMVFIGALTIITLSIALFSVLINNLVIKRIKRLNQGVEQVIQGNYDVVLKSKGIDEVSQLFSNFNVMTQSLNNNAYVNKAFARNFSHEIKTPLSVILGYAELMLDEKLSQEEYKNFLQFIIEETKRLDKLSKNMLYISQVEHLTLIEKKDTFNVSEMIRNIVQNLQLLWEEKNLNIDIHFEDIYITSNQELLYQVFYNVIHNAITYTGHDETIKMDIKKDNDVVFSITNPGHLEVKEQKEIFDLFVKKDQSRTHKSTGVGLTLAKTIMNKLGGDVQVTSEDQTITFFITWSSHH